jgi:hypothetical protein
VMGLVMTSMPRGLDIMPRLVMAKELDRPEIMLSLALDGFAARNKSSTYVFMKIRSPLEVMSVYRQGSEVDGVNPSLRRVFCEDKVPGPRSLFQTIQGSLEAPLVARGD